MTQSKRTRRLATYDDVLNAPEHMVAEIVDGVLYTSPRPSGRNGLATSALIAHLAPFQQNLGAIGGWWIAFQPELHFGEDVVVPDLLGWRCERLPEFYDEPFETLAPDWICEVLSPSTERLDRVEKLQVYARERVPHAWLVDPIDKTVEVLTLNRSRRWKAEAIHYADERIHAVPFEAVEIDLETLWRPTAATVEKQIPTEEKQGRIGVPRRITPRKPPSPRKRS